MSISTFSCLLQPQNVTQLMFLFLKIHVMVLMQDVSHLHGGSSLLGSNSISGVFQYPNFHTHSGVDLAW